jgi:phenylpyruvate tautomerase PptA (4-oxalocrotonate tautomerase family)
MVELKLPDIGLDTLEARAAFITAATEIVGRLTVAGHDPDNTWVNILNAPSGAWGIAGVAYTGEDLLKAASAAV